MDRVLLLFDDLQYAGHIEKTLRKMGFDTETITNDYNINEKILTFNPDFLVIKGAANSKASALTVGKKLKDSIKFNGKVVLMFPEDGRPGSEDLIRLRMDLLLIEPISALRLSAHILSLSGRNHDAIMDRILRVANSDLAFRSNEQQILKQLGESIDTEIQMISEKFMAEEQELMIDDSAILSFIDPQYRSPTPDAKESPQTPVGSSQPAPGAAAKTSEPASAVTPKPVQATELKPAASKPTTDASKEATDDHSADYLLEPDLGEKLKAELAKADSELPLRIEGYNQAISAIDQDLKKGINKRQTKKRALELLDVTPNSEKKGRDEERKQFAKALFKK
jgi:DNA-binding response OmpR family regulator